MENRARRAAGIAFCVFFALMLLLPPILTNTVPGYKSDFDNQVYPDFPKAIGRKTFSEFEEYVNFRVGLREEAVTAYQVLNYRLFSLVEHPNYMRGEESYLFSSGLSLIRDFQRLNVDEAYLDRMIAYVRAFDDLCRRTGRKFYYFLVPEKQEIYPEYYPRGFNVANTPSRTEVYLDKLEETKLSHYSAMADLLVRKQAQQVYNVEFDAGHWNAHGRFFANQRLMERVKADFPAIRIPRAEDYDITMELKTSLLISHFPIHEYVPVYTLRQSGAVLDESRFEIVELAAPNRYHRHYVNDSAATPLKLLFFGDSFMDGAELYYLNNFREVTFLHADNLPLAYRLIEEFDPDVVILEHVTRGLGVNARFGDKLITDLDALRENGQKP